jgi:hypothetical protein
MSNFDGIFIMRLANCKSFKYHMDVKSANGIIYEIIILNKDDDSKIPIRDSYYLIPMALDDA